MRQPTRVFISYSHESPVHQNRVRELADRLRQDGFDAWIDQYEVEPPSGWTQWMMDELDRADRVVIVCTEDYYRAYRGQAAQGWRLGVRWEGAIIRMQHFQAETRNERFHPVTFGPTNVRHVPDHLRDWTRCDVASEEGYCELVRLLDGQPRAQAPAIGMGRRPRTARLPPQPPADARQRFPAVFTSRLPSTGRDLFGRGVEVGRLTRSWNDGKSNVITIVAWGGVGKTALVNHWLAERMAPKDYRGAERVYAWSFYSQGTKSDIGTSDEFFEHALPWFGGDDPAAIPIGERPGRLADLIRERRALLILDGLEPLQRPDGSIADTAVRELLRELAASNAGLCVVTTRVAVTDLDDYAKSTAPMLQLDHLAPAAGAQILASLGVQGPRDELEQASREVDGHALALILTGTYLAEACSGDVGRRSEARLLTDFETDERAKHAYKALAAHEAFLTRHRRERELAILRIVGLFDRPAEAGAIAALRTGSAIDGLTEPIVGIEDAEWNRAAAHLRRLRLLAEPEVSDPGGLDAHPLVREFMALRLQADTAESWRQGHLRLYDHYNNVVTEYPAGPFELHILYEAMTHASRGGRPRTALQAIYQERIRRGDRAFSEHTLGAYGAEHRALQILLESSPAVSDQERLAQGDIAYVHRCLGYCLRALGQLQKAVKFMESAIEMHVAEGDLVDAAVGTGILSYLLCFIGKLGSAKSLARRSVELADRSGSQYESIARRTNLAFVYHMQGDFEAAHNLYREAERKQADLTPDHPLLHSFMGMRYCELLLDIGQPLEAAAHAETTRAWANETKASFSVHLDSLMLARASMLTGAAGALTREHIDGAVAGLKAANIQHHVPRGLLVRAEYARGTQDWEAANKDVAEVTRVARRTGMRLWECEGLLEEVRLSLARAEREADASVATRLRDQARATLSAASRLVEEMGYHRRDEDVMVLSAALSDET